jgi:putative flippase GtrA
VDPKVSRLPPIAKQFIRYASFGVVGTAAHFVVYIALVNAAFGVILSSVAGFVVGALTNYWLNYHYTFTSDQPHHQAMTKFFTVAIIGLTINTSIVFMLDRMQWHYLLAQIAATAIVLAWNFTANRLWTFGGD